MKERKLLPAMLIMLAVIALPGCSGLSKAFKGLGRSLRLQAEPVHGSVQAAPKLAQAAGRGHEVEEAGS